MKNITLSADEKLIEAAHARLQRYDQVSGALRGKVRVGRKLTRDEMNEH